MTLKLQGRKKNLASKKTERETPNMYMIGCTYKIWGPTETRILPVRFNFLITSGQDNKYL